MLTDMQQAGVTCSAVGVATHSAAEDTKMTQMADGAAKGGKYYKVKDPNDLPAIYMRESRRVFLPVVVATIPAVLVGFALEHYLRALFAAPAIAAAFLVVNGLLLLFGGLSILLGWRPVFGVAALVFFLVMVTPVMHNFWDETGMARMNDMANFLKNVALAGGSLMLVAVPRPWRRPSSSAQWTSRRRS